MTKFNDLLNNLKESIKEMLTKDKTPQEIEKISGLDKKLDELDTEYKNVIQENSQLKDSLIASVKNSGFKSNNQEENIEEQPKTFEELALKIVEKRQKGN